MLTYIIRRLLLLIPVLIGVSLLTFFIIRAAVDDPAFTYLQTDRPSQQQLEAIREKYHLNEPIYIQYVYWFKGILEGDWGWSKQGNGFVTDVIINRFPATFELAMLSMFMSVMIGIFLGTISAVRANTWLDQGTRVLSLVAVSIPVFWLGIILLHQFYYEWDWLPGPGRYDAQFAISSLEFHSGFLTLDTLVSGEFNFFLNVVAHLVLPAITLAFATTAIIVRMMRASMLEVLSAEYVRTARSKGVPEHTVITRHARRNALIPTTTVIGLSFGGLLGGAVLTETIFAWPGLGQWSASAAVNLDTAGIMGFTLITATIYVLANLIVDLIYAYLDPRVRLG